MFYCVAYNPGHLKDAVCAVRGRHPLRHGGIASPSPLCKHCLVHVQHPRPTQPMLVQAQRGIWNIPPPPCKSYALVQATAGVGTVFIWDLILFGTKCSAAAYDTGLVANLPGT